MTSHAEPARLSPQATPLDFVQSVLEASHPEGAIVVVTIPAPVAPLEALLEAGPAHGDAVLWEPPDGPAFSGIGAAVELVGSGAQRFASIEQQASTLFPLLAARALGDDAPAPRLFGGFSFEAGWAASPPWMPFGDARFVLPRLRYARARDRAWLSLAMRAADVASADARAGGRAELETALSVLRGAAGRGGVRTARPRRPVVGTAGTTESEWRVLVEAIRARIGGGDFEKVVAARQTTLSFESEVDPADVLAELALSQPSCTRFAFRFGGATFVGSSPERLVRRDGLSIDTEALAGSNRTGDAGRLELLASSKDRAEHEPVLREIVSNLSPLCDGLEYPDVPEVRTLRHLLHLRTPVKGRLKAPLHVLSLVERLHPTPAVGGFPTRDAVRFIVEHEPLARGWYASPVGSFDASGNGEFAVALRSGVITGRDVVLFAGGGIVRDSNPESEFTETRLKLAALQAALRVVE
jgi:isochorismate synthase